MTCCEMCIQFMYVLCVPKRSVQCPNVSRAGLITEVCFHGHQIVNEMLQYFPLQCHYLSKHSMCCQQKPVRTLLS